MQVEFDSDLQAFVAQIDLHRSVVLASKSLAAATAEAEYFLDDELLVDEA